MAPVAAVAEAPATTAPAAQVAAAPVENFLFKPLMSMEDLLKQVTEVSSLKPLTTRESPNVMTLITADEIANSGARDLMDVLRLVPAFEFGVDVSGVVDTSTRGIWSHEGKLLFLLDGQPINEIAYGTMALGNHFPVEQIKQIEIIRGPGSAIYGGYAELGVINVITKNGKDLNGASMTGVYSEMSRTYSHRNLELSAGKQIEDLDVAAHVFWGQGNRSEGTFKSFYTAETYDMATSAQLNPFLVNLGLKYKGLSVRSILDEYHTTERDWWGADLPEAVRADFNTRILDVQYDWKIADLTVTPRINFKEQEPYQRNGVGTKEVTPETYTDPGDHQFELWLRRQTESLTASYDFSAKDNLLGGIECYQEQMETIQDSYYPQPTVFKYYNVAAFAQGLVDLSVVNLTAGARFERHNRYGNSFVPRLGVTKVFDPFHVKLLFSKAFRVPQAETIELSDVAKLANPSSSDIRPETSRTVEFETGYKLNDKMFLTLNVFDTYINDMIIYFVTSVEYQLNSGAFGNRGAELSYNYRDTWGFVNLGYAFNHIYQNEGFIHPETSQLVPSIYWVPGHDDRVVGLPNNKLTLNANIRVLDQLSLNPSVILFNERYGYTKLNLDEQGNMIPEVFPTTLIVNLFVSFAVTKELHLGVGVNDIGNSAPPFIQAYNGGHAPIPGPSRAYIGKINYDLNF
jgi:outer membrane receptor for ferrienterochelin and colicin